jgi:hypothetical protein
VVIALYCPVPAQLAARATQAMSMSHEYFLFIDTPFSTHNLMKGIKFSIAVADGPGSGKPSKGWVQGVGDR